MSTINSVLAGISLLSSVTYSEKTVSSISPFNFSANGVITRYMEMIKFFY